MHPWTVSNLRFERHVNALLIHDDLCRVYRIPGQPPVSRCGKLWTLPLPSQMTPSAEWNRIRGPLVTMSNRKSYGGYHSECDIHSRA